VTLHGRHLFQVEKIPTRQPGQAITAGGRSSAGIITPRAAQGPGREARPLNVYAVRDEAGEERQAAATVLTIFKAARPLPWASRGPGTCS